jgi:hypothetical protein
MKYLTYLSSIIAVFVGTATIITTQIGWLRIVACSWFLLVAIVTAYALGQTSKKGVTKK